MLRSLYRLLRRNTLHHLLPSSQSALFANQTSGVEIAGFFQSASGIGESARLCARQLRHHGYRVRCVSIEPFFRKPRELAWDFEDDCSREAAGARIIHVNPPMLPPVVAGLGWRRYASIYNIGYWAWELDRIPDEWVRVSRCINAVFTPSEFSSEPVRARIAKPVLTVSHPVTCPSAAEGMRAKLGIGPDVFLVTNVFSFGSGVGRKNPWAVAEAFKAAFGEDPGVRLVFKSNHGSGDEKRKLHEAAGASPNIILLDDIWSRDEVAGLVKDSNLYVSLHRSEGFGLTIAEAMRLGTPVMTSDWSGNMDFCNADNCFLVPARQVPVTGSNREFGGLTNLTWADPDIEFAASLLKRIRDNPDLSRGKAETCLNQTNAFFDRPHYVSALTSLQALEAGLAA